MKLQRLTPDALMLQNNLQDAAMYWWKYKSASTPLAWCLTVGLAECKKLCQWSKHLALDLLSVMAACFHHGRMWSPSTFNPYCLPMLLPQCISGNMCQIHWLWQTEVQSSLLFSNWVVSQDASHFLNSPSLKQKVRDQQILTSGWDYDSILMQFSFSNSLIITLWPGNLKTHPF